MFFSCWVETTRKTLQVKIDVVISRNNKKLEKKTRLTDDAVSGESWRAVGATKKSALQNLNSPGNQSHN